MSVRHDLYRHYAFLPPSGPDKGNTQTSWELGANIVGGIQQLGELIATKEIIVDDTPWEARLHMHRDSGEPAKMNNDPTAIAENYITHKADTATAGRRTFEFDRPLYNSPTGASRLRLQIDTPDGAAEDQYAYRLTTYTPRTPPEVTPEAFNEDEYLQIKALMESGDTEALNALLEPVAPEAEAVTPFPLVAFQDIHSQFMLRWLKREQRRVPYIQTATFREESSHESLARVLTPVNADHSRIEKAYSPGTLPKLSHNQAAVRSVSGVHGLVHHNLALALRHLVA
jgi:hypothetical protein